MPNTFAYVMIFVWPIVAIVLFRRLPRADAIIWTILGGYLLLPMKTVVDLPLLPALDKDSIPAVSALLLCLPALRRVGDLAPRDRIPKALIVVFLLCPFATAATNGAAIAYGPRVVPGLSIYDGFGDALAHSVSLIPFLIGQRFLSAEKDLIRLLVLIALGGLAYSLPTLFEIRMSPQLHSWIYGFFPHDFAQQVRYGGFRPVVFLGHGLTLSLFIATAVIAVAAVWRGRRVGAWGLATAWLAGTLMLCKTLSGWLYAGAFAPIVFFAGRRVQRITLLATALVVLLYPVLRGADLIPTQSILSLAAMVDDERAGSLEFRFDNEDALLSKANQQPLFGWGGWGRSRVKNEETGEDVSVTDGWWVILIGKYGWAGYVAEFGLLCWPLLAIGATAAGRRASFAAIALGLVMCANMIHQIPNAGLSPVTWLVAGAMTGALARRRAEAAAPRPAVLAARKVPS